MMQWRDSAPRELRRVIDRVHPIVGRWLRGPEVTALESDRTHKDREGLSPIVGELTADDLAQVVRLACYVKPRSDEEQLLLLKTASELEHLTGSSLMDEVRESAGFPQRELELPGALTTAAKVAAAGGALAGGWRVARHLLKVRRQRAVTHSQVGHVRRRDR